MHRIFDETLVDDKKNIIKECVNVYKNFRKGKTVINIRGEKDFDIADLEGWLKGKSSDGNPRLNGWHLSWDRKVGSKRHPNCVYPIMFRGKLLPNSKKLPRLSAMLDKLKDERIVNLAGLSLLPPGAKLYPHKDVNGYASNLATLNYCVFAEEGCGLKVGEKFTHLHKPGEYIIFDGQTLHEAYNDSERDRLVLVIGIGVSDEDIAMSLN